MNQRGLILHSAMEVIGQLFVSPIVEAGESANERVGRPSHATDHPKNLVQLGPNVSDLFLSAMCKEFCGIGAVMQGRSKCLLAWRLGRL